MEHWHGMQWTMPPAQAPTCPTCGTTSAHATRTARDPSALHSCTFYLVDAKHQAPCQTSASAVSLAASMLDVHSNYSANKCCFALLIPDAGNLFWLCVSSGQRNVHTYIHIVQHMWVTSLQWADALCVCMPHILLNICHWRRQQCNLAALRGRQTNSRTELRAPNQALKNSWNWSCPSINDTTLQIRD